MKETVYVETSVISYLVAKPSRDLITATRQQMTIEWWESNREEFDLVASQVVVDESASGDSLRASERLSLLSGILLLDVIEGVFMFDDPIIEEVRSIRDRIAARFNYDVKAIGAYYRAQQLQNKVPVITRQPRQPELDEPVIVGNQSQVAEAAAA